MLGRKLLVASLAMTRSGIKNNPRQAISSACLGLRVHESMNLGFTNAVIRYKSMYKICFA